MGRIISSQDLFNSPSKKVVSSTDLFSSDNQNDNDIKSLREAPQNFIKEMTNPNPSVASTVFSGNFAPLRAGMATLQPVYDELKTKLRDKPIPDFIKRTTPIGIAGEAFERILPEDKKWIAKGAKATGIDLVAGSLAGGIAESVPKIPIRGISLGERAMNLPFSKLFATEEGQVSKAANLGIKARDKAVKLYPNQDGSLEDIRNTGEQTAKYVSKSKDYEDVANQMEMAKGVSGEELGKVYDSNTLSNSRTQHDPLLDYISKLEESSLGKTQSGRNAIKKLKDLHTADVDTLNTQSPETLNDPNFYQKQKEMFQTEANRLGAYDDPESGAMAKGLQKMSEGYQNKVYSVEETVKPLLNEQSGLIKSHEMARDMATKEALDQEPSITKTAADSVSSNPLVGAIRFAKRKMFGSPAKALTKSISKNMANAEEAQNLADLIRKMKEPESATLEMDFPRQLSAPPQKSLPSPEDFRTRDIKAGRLLQNQAQGKSIRSGSVYGNKPVNEPSIPKGKSQIDLPELTDSQIQELAKKWGVPERNVRETVNASDIEPVVKSSSTDGLIMSSKRRKEVFDIMKRREQNFRGR